MLLLGPFIDADVAASQTNAQLVLVGVANDGIVMPAAGWVVGILGTLDAAGSAGTLTVGPTIDGTEQADLTQTITTQTEFREVMSPEDGAPRFAAGQQIGVEITSDGSWNGTTSDLAAFVLVQLEDVID